MAKLFSDPKTGDLDKVVCANCGATTLRQPLYPSGRHETRTVNEIRVLDPLAEAIAGLLWEKLQQRFSSRENTELLSVPAAAKRLSISKTKLHSMISAGDIPAKLVRRIGRRTLIVASELERWVSAQ
jgi:excisionase family DNA binding protein